MYKINIELFSDRKIKMTSASAGVTGENNGTELVFKIPLEYASYTKYLDVFKENGDILQTVVSVSDENEFTYILPKMLSEHLNVYMQLVLKKGNEVFKSYRFVLTFEEGINATEYLESEFQDSIQNLYETKADKTEVEKLEKSIENKLTFKMFADEKGMLLDLLDTKADRTSVPTRLSELHDDSGRVPIEKSVKSISSDVTDRAAKDANGRIIHETYAKKDDIPYRISQLIDDSDFIKNLYYMNDEELKSFKDDNYAFVFYSDEPGNFDPSPKLFFAYYYEVATSDPDGMDASYYLTDQFVISPYERTIKKRSFRNNVWSSWETVGFFSDVNFTKNMSDKLDSIPNGSDIATKAELLEAIGEALEGDY